MVAGAGAPGEADGTVLLRPEQIVLAPAGEGRPAEVCDQTFLGPLVWLDLRVDGVALQACWPAAVASGVGAKTRVAVQGTVRVFPA